MLDGLVEHRIINKRDIYTISQLCSLYHNMNTKIRSIDLVKKLQEKFKEKLRFVKPSYCVNWNSSEYIMSSCDNLIGECVQAANLGEGIKKAKMIKKPVTLNK